MNILCLRVEDGKVQPIAYSDSDISKKVARRLLRKFKNDADVSGISVVNYARLYDSKTEARSQLPQV
jgi:hypothetical protein